MRISVVTISFNQAGFLARAIDSVLGQAWPDKEYIVVDAGSTDGSREIIAGYGARLDRTVLEPDRGAADGLNKGFALATGEVLCFLNSDDEFLPGAFERIADEFSRRPHADFVSGCGYFVDAGGKRLGRVVPTRLSVVDYVYGSCTVFQQGTFFRRRCLDGTGGFNPENRTCWDGELFLDFARAGFRHEVVYRDLALFRIHGASISGSGRAVDAYRRDVLRLFAKVKGRRPTHGDRVIAAGFRATKLLRHPRYAVERVLHG